MEIKNGQDLLNFLKGLTEEQLKAEVLFDTEARTFEYHMAKIGRIYYEDTDECMIHISLHEERTG
jgi:hypothetical protein